jgi:hypothetical protein
MGGFDRQVVSIIGSQRLGADGRSAAYATTISVVSKDQRFEC